MAEGQICSVEGCTKILNKTEGRICNKHRTRFHRHGDYHTISPKWPNLKKGVPLLTPLGYLRINVDGKRVLHHRYVMEQYLGRNLSRNERVHHINGDMTDNRIENLELYDSQSDHMKNNHRYLWKNRKIRPQYDAKTIEQILHRLAIKPAGRGHRKTIETCFCGNPCECRNLCSKHYYWAYTHKFF